jgi:hypothetical protein
MTVNGPIQTKNNHGNLQKKRIVTEMKKTTKLRFQPIKWKRKGEKNWKKKTTWINLNEQATYASQVMWTEIRQ